MDQWFYLEADGSQRGPLTLDELLAAFRSRSPQTQVWRAGMAQWVPAASLPELRAALMPAGGVSARAGPPERATLNPWTIFKRSFFPSGRFGRGEFAIAYFGPWVAVFALYLVGFALAALLGAMEEKPGGDGAPVIVIMAILPAVLLQLVTIYTNFVAWMRRLRDRGHSAWMALLMLVACVNFAMLCYLLLAPTRAD